jgi:hydrogenase nickel incorporation protein HypA/HybF
MHEASVALNILDTVIDQCSRQGYQTITSVRLRIGKAAGILPDALLFAFDIAKQGTPAHDAELVIDAEPLGGQCLACGKSFTSEERFVFFCPACGATTLEVTRGLEMQILDMEVEE